jgi:hypothetical protein
MVDGIGWKVEGRRLNDWGFQSVDWGFLKGLCSDFYRDRKVEGCRHKGVGWPDGIGIALGA